MAAVPAALAEAGVIVEEAGLAGLAMTAGRFALNLLRSLAGVAGKVASDWRLAIGIPLAFKATEVAKSYMEAKKVQAETVKQELEAKNKLADSLIQQGRYDEAARMLSSHWDYMASVSGKKGIVDTLKDMMNIKSATDAAIVLTLIISGTIIIDRVLD